MRIIQVHNVYQQAGGEDAVVANEGALLRERGHGVQLLSVSNDTIKGPRKALTAWRASYSPWGRKQLAKAIAESTPDVVHVHNFFPLLSPSIYDACQSAGVPVVQTLHNYRTICPGALLMRDGRTCELCIAASPYQAVRHRCYRGSRLGSLVVAHMVDVHQKRGTWHTKVDRFIALTEFAKSKFVEAGFPAIKIVVKPNFVEAATTHSNDDAERSGALFVGRLSEEKGIATLLKAWSSIDAPLRVVGEGPLIEMVRDAPIDSVTCLGGQPSDEVFREMKKSSFLIVPSQWYEGFPMIIAEAFSCGLPVLCSELGSMAEIIKDGATGLHFRPGDPDDLAAKVRWAAAHPQEMRQMGANARNVFEQEFAPGVNYERLMEIYAEAIGEHS